MSSAVTESATYSPSITGPDGTDPRTAASVRTPLAQLASRNKWLKEQHIAGSAKLVDISGDDYPLTTTYATVDNVGSTVFANFTLTVAVGDIVYLSAVGAMQGDTAAREYFLRWHDGTNAIVEQYFAMNAGIVTPFAVNGLRVVTTAGSTTFAFQGKRGASSHVVIGSTDLHVHCLHIKNGA